MRIAAALLALGSLIPLAGCDSPASPAAGIAQEIPAASDPRPKVELPPDLWTRKRGVDWPTFLGPTGDSKSTESGILTRWEGRVPRIVWQRKLGTGYGAPTTSRGRLFQFDRFDEMARLYCLNAETGGELWRYEYKTEYEDTYGY